MEVYIVRIYRREKGNPDYVVGTVEEPGKPERKTFAGAEELWKILGTGKPTRRKRISADSDER